VLLGWCVTGGEVAALQAGEQSILLRRRAAGERRAVHIARTAVEGCQATPIDLKLVVVRAGQRPIDVGHDANVRRTRLAGACREEALEDRGRHAGLVRAESKKSRLPVPIVSRHHTSKSLVTAYRLPPT